tara:strand:+ start:96 stop:395 length:300 start_codon:yes stop_codon:yes gene_type:complete
LDELNAIKLILATQKMEDAEPLGEAQADVPALIVIPAHLKESEVVEQKVMPFSRLIPTTHSEIIGPQDRDIVMAAQKQHHSLSMAHRLEEQIRKCLLTW